MIDNYVTVPAAATPDMFEAIPGTLDNKVKGELNDVGYLAVATAARCSVGLRRSSAMGGSSLAEVLSSGGSLCPVRLPREPLSPQHHPDAEQSLRRFPASGRGLLPRRWPARGRRPVACGSTTPTRWSRSAGRPGLPLPRPAGQADGGDMALTAGCITMRGHRRIPRVRARTGAWHLSRLRDRLDGRRPVVRAAPHHPDAEYPLRDSISAAMGFGSPDSVHLLVPRP